MANPTLIKLKFARILRDKLNEKYGKGFVGSKRFQIIVEDKSNPPEKYPPIIGENGIQKGPSEGAIGHVVHVGWRTAEKPLNYDLEHQQKKDRNFKGTVDPEEPEIKIITATVEPEGAEILYILELGEAECTGGGEGCGADLSPQNDNPYDPYSIDKMQYFFASSILRKMLREDPEEDNRPFIKYNDGGHTVFVRNPFYRQVDPIKSMIKHGHNGRGFMFVRNPFAAPAEYNPFVSTADFWFNSDFNRGNIDPYWY